MKARGVRRVYYRCGCVCDYASRRRRAQRQGVALEQPHVGAVGLVDRTETECASGPPLGLNSLRSGLHLSCVEAADLPTTPLTTHLAPYGRTARRTTP